MRRIIPVLVLTFCSFVLLISVMPTHRNDNKNQSSMMYHRHAGISNELHNKHTVLQRDLEQTRQLNRLQCSQHILQVLHDHKTNAQANMEDILHDLQIKHPHMIQLSWIEPSQSLDEALHTGHIPEALKDSAHTTMREALLFLKSQHREKVFQSAPIHNNDEEYFVLGATQGDHGPYLLGFMHQHLLKQINIEQRKNLRIVPYPSDKRYKIKSIDADTLHGVKVRNAEQNEGVSHYHIQQVVVKFNVEPTAQQLAQIQTDMFATMIKKIGYTYVFQSDTLTAEQMITYFQTMDIAFVEPHYLYMTNDIPQQFTPNDVLFQQYQWNLPMIDTMKGWTLTKESDDVIVAVIDTGVDLDHTDLADRFVSGFNTVDEGALPYDDVGHGTHVAGIISAIVNNGEGVAGMSWFNKVMPIKALDHTGAGSTYSVAQGIIWAVDHGAKVINMSLGNYMASEFLHDAVKYAFDHDVVLISATGNDDTVDPGYPAAYPEVMAVAATNSMQQRASFSNYGNYVDVAAPGENIASTYPDDEYAAMSGTSMASPHVAALAAMIRTTKPALTNVEVMDIIRRSSLDLGDQGHDQYYGYGQIDVARALELTLNPDTPLALNNNNEPQSFWTSLIDRILQRIAESLY